MNSAAVFWAVVAMGRLLRLLRGPACVLAWAGIVHAPRGACAQVTPLRLQTDTVIGETAVVPVRTEADAKLSPVLTLRLDDGREVPAALLRVVSEPPAACDRGGWVPAPGSWRVRPPSDGERADGGGGWLLVFDLPRDAIGQSVWAGDRQISLNWLPGAASLCRRLGLPTEPVAGTGAAAHPWASVLPEAWRSRPDLMGFLEPMGHHPPASWREELATEGLGVAGGLTVEERGGPGIDVERLLASAAREEDDVTRAGRAVRTWQAGRWRAALATLWALDRGLSVRVRRLLAGAAVFPVDPAGVAPGVVVAPVFAASERDAERLLEVLNSPRLMGSQKLARARSWVESFPPAVAHALDDAGGPGLPGTAVVALAVSGEGGITAMTRAGGPRAEPGVLAPGEAMTRLVPLSGDRDGGEISCAVGEWSATVRPIPTLPAAPPGVAVGPLVRAHDAASFVGGGPTAADVVPCGGLVYRGPDGEWLLLLEGEFAAGGDEAVRVWLGAFGQTAGVLTLRVRAEGGVTFAEDVRRAQDWLDAAAAERAGRSGVVTAETDGDTWRAIVRLPGWARDADGRLRVGVEHTDGCGRRSSWPRRMLPWQLEPGRAVVDLSAWDG